MSTLYIQNLLKILLDGYEDIDYMLDQVPRATRRDSEKIRRLLTQLEDQNHRLLERVETPAKTPVKTLS